MILKLYAAMLLLVSGELADISTNERHEAYRRSMLQLAEWNVYEGSTGLMYSAEFDPLVLTAVQYGESRFKRWAETATAVGPMQLEKASSGLDWAEIAPWEAPKVTRRTLRDWRSNVHLGYLMLAREQYACDAYTDLGRVFSSYRFARCQSEGRAKRDFHAKQRCGILRSLADQVGVRWPEGVTCTK